VTLCSTSLTGSSVECTMSIGGAAGVAGAVGERPSFTLK
jgi:hypothetical protein